MAQIFISYSRVDETFVELFIKRLQSALPKLIIWHHKAPHALIGDDKWWQDILTAIAKSDVFIYILSNESVNSVYCQAEFTEARRLQKPVITVQARDRTERTDDLDDIQYVDMKNGVDDAEVFTRLVAVVNLGLKEGLKARSRPLWKSATPKPPKEAPHVRTIGDEDAETPKLGKPTAEIEALNLAQKTLRQQRIGMIIAVVIGVLVLIIAVIELIPRNNDWTPVEREFDGVVMVLVPAGCFRMGSDIGKSDEQPIHAVCIDEPFWLDKIEVTQAQFAAKGGLKANSNRFSGDNRPIEQITWFEAEAFCREQRGGRLPTEVEWEFAARGPDGLLYPWGNDFVEENAVFNQSSSQGTEAVGSRPGGESWVGAWDLSGNVWEWVSSVYQSYPYDLDDGHEDLTANGNRVLRGGSWLQLVYASWRYHLPPEFYVYDVGFRCARSFVTE